MDAFKKYIVKSKKFSRLFYINFAVLALLCMLTFIRLLTGIMRNKPAVLIAVALIALLALSVFYLIRLTNFMCTNIIPAHYKKQILPSKKVKHNWQWHYFLLDDDALEVTFIPLVGYVNRNLNSTNNDASCGTSCGSSCGSSCSSCGGCGGGGD